MLKSSLCDYSDLCILVSGTMTVAPQGGDNPNNFDKIVVFKNFAPFSGCISEINNAQIDNAKDIDVVLPMCNFIEYSRKLFNNIRKFMARYYSDQTSLNNINAVANKLIIIINCLILKKYNW